MSLSETLNQYKTLKSTLSELTLPDVNSATLSTHTEIVNINSVHKAIADFSATQGWVQYSDELVISAQAPRKPYILEAQYCNAQNNSLHIKLQQGENYILSTFITENKPTENQYYTEQKLIVRNNLKGKAESANYRLWWQLENSGVNEGRWLPLSQQFLGFNTENSTMVNSATKEGK